MKKTAVLLICLIITASKGLCYWQQVMQGMYMDNYSVQNNIIKISYKYTMEYKPLYEQIKNTPNAQILNVDSMTQDIEINCATKTLSIKNITFYDKSGNIVFNAPEAPMKSAPPEILKYCQ